MNLVSALYSSWYPFNEMGLFNSFKKALSPKDLNKGDVLVVWGGQDISPSLYNKPVGRYTDADATPSYRDMAEWNLMKAAQQLDIPIIGICRGAQMLCALSGGFLIQDVSNHCQGHEIITSNGEILQVSSLHHQMMYPFEVDHELIARSKSNLSTCYMDVDDFIDVPCEPEYVYFPKVKGMAIQWHPEFMEVNSPANKFVKHTLEEFL